MSRAAGTYVESHCGCGKFAVSAPTAAETIAAMRAHRDADGCTAHLGQTPARGGQPTIPLRPDAATPAPPPAAQPPAKPRRRAGDSKAQALAALAKGGRIRVSRR